MIRIPLSWIPGIIAAILIYSALLYKKVLTNSLILSIAFAVILCAGIILSAIIHKKIAERRARPRPSSEYERRMRTINEFREKMDKH